MNALALSGDQPLTDLLERLQRIEGKLDELLNKSDTQEQQSYSTADVARILGKAEWTVREWCRLGRINAKKRRCGRGTAKEWKITNVELRRIQSEGLLPSRSPLVTY